ncbi:hypothetical protein Taro_029547 [Colocasia esculenta]|uniref:Uncharacterized protein n=1 Tax=Colocasia esculenta TaxID=4460 RepID=A0A843VRG4_COLES|nr:hypothetical protein [Colocasia esculenta]
MFFPSTNWSVNSSFLGFPAVEYDFVDEEGMPANMVDVTKFCEYSISNKVKEWRATLKKAGYMMGINGEFSKTPPNERVSPETWDLLLQYWKNPKKIQETERNKKNRAEEQATHTLGAKSIARHHHEQLEKLGDSYSTVGAYVKAHQTKSGEYPNEYTHAICEKAIATCEERNFASSSDPSVLTPVLDVVYNRHHGGYERGRGLGWSRVAWSHNMANEARNDNIRWLTVELENTQSELQNAMAEIQGVRARERERWKHVNKNKLEIAGFGVEHHALILQVDSILIPQVDIAAPWTNIDVYLHVTKRWFSSC